MIRRILNLIVALSTIAVSATAQTLSVSSIETELGAQTEIVVNVEGASEMTALQFTLNLPDGVSLSYLKGNCGMYLGDATDEHVMSVSPLSDGGRFIMIYSTDLNTFSDGVLLRIPVKMPAEVCSENGSFSDICFSTVNADSRECSDVKFTAVVGENGEDATGIKKTTVNGEQTTVIYDLQGRRVEYPTKGIYIVNGRKVVIK